MKADILNLLFFYFKDYGYYILFFALLLENVVFLGLIVPGETVLLLASFFASFSHFNIFYIVIIGIIGALLGNILGYVIGLKGGRSFIEKFGGRFFISEKRIKDAEQYFDIHGGKTVFIGRFATGIRVFIAPLAGASRMNFVKFFFYTLAAVVSWTILIAALGYFFGENWVTLLKIINRAGWAALVLIVVFLALFYFYRRKYKKG